MPCPFCLKEEPVRIDIKSPDLRICPNCKASFLPEEHLPELRRSLSNTTKIHWIKVLSSCKKENEQCNGEVLCIEHKIPLEKGIVPGFSIESLVPKCCSLMHLSPSVMEQILSLGLSASTNSRSQKGGIARFLGSFLFYILERRKPIEDGIDRLQYDSKFSHVLEG